MTTPPRNMMMTRDGSIIPKPPLRCICPKCGADLALAVKRYHERPRGTQYRRGKETITHCIKICDSLTLDDIKRMADKMGLERWPER
jgi:hypothetical protein